MGTRRFVGVAAGFVVLSLLLACAGAAPQKVRPRDELRQLLQGKTKAEVQKTLGRPEQTKEIPGGEMWMYRGITHDPATGRTDPLTWVHFDAEGRVGKVDF